MYAALLAPNLYDFISYGLARLYYNSKLVALIYAVLFTLSDIAGLVGGTMFVVRSFALHTYDARYRNMSPLFYSSLLVSSLVSSHSRPRADPCVLRSSLFELQPMLSYDYDSSL